MKRWQAASLVVLSSLSVQGNAGERADKLGLDGIYAGKIGMQLQTDKGTNLNYDAAAKLVIMPNGGEAILTAQHPEGVVSLALRGEIRENVFYAESKPRQDFGGFHYGMKWDIRLDPKRGTAVLHGKAMDRPRWSKDDDFLYTFRKQPKSSR